MPDEKTATRALSGKRQMMKQFGPLHAVFTPGGLNEWRIFSNSDWKPMDPGANPSESAFGRFYAESYFDTSGYTRDELTTMFDNIFIQEAGRWQLTNAGNVRVQVFDLVMTTRFNDGSDVKMDQFVLEFQGGNYGVPGFNQSLYDWSQVQYGRYREYLATTQGTDTTDVLAPVNDQQFGSLESTTADKLWTYKLVFLTGWFPNETGHDLRIPNTRQVVQANIVSEPDLTFLMRQKRSYELTNY
jgi:hypothetical protein